MPSQQHRDGSSNGKQQRYRVAGLGIELLGAISGFVFVGLWIDSHYDVSPWGLLICTVMGFVGGFYNLIRVSLKELNPSPEKKRKTPSDHVDE